MSSSDIFDELVTQQDEFINHARSRVYNYVRQQRRRDLTQIIEKDAYGPAQHRTHHPGLDSYVVVLGCFCAKRPYNDHDLDSVLTDPVVEIVCNCYSELLQRNSDELNAYLTQKILANEIVLQETLKIVMSDLSAKGFRISQAKLAKVVHDTMSQAVLHAAHSKLGIVIQHGVTAAAGSTAGQMLAKMLVKAIAHHVTTITAHIMSNTMIAAAVKAAAKKICVVAITAVIVKTLAAKLGVTSAAGAVGVAGWVFLGGYLTYKLAGLPEEMAEKVSNGVRDALMDNYKPCLEQILASLTESASDPEKIAALITSEMMGLSEFQRELEKGVDLDNEDLPQLEKDVRKGVLKTWGYATKRR
ncbi:hypothetical protein FBEOM_8611 [Fusarium beomiforme]|uniref:Uncharacterized protein n=1 Tax=Fusarium beomiforme TaxID=44412 RepID=A0A9P5DX37_9HYPO|nr:hypothetical protein FBEOM_8611 [Fusarium beomiforme]